MSEKPGFFSMVKLGIVLALYAATACVGLAFVYTGTSGIIAQRQQADLEAALRELFPTADSFKPIGDIVSPDPMVSIEGDRENPGNTGAFEAVKNNSTLGLAIRTSRASYSGPIKILVGVGTDAKIKGIKILENNDTPGLGGNAGSKTYFIDRARGLHFYDQFRGKPVEDPFVAKQDVVAITSATITSAAISASVKAAGEAALNWMRNSGRLH